MNKKINIVNNILTLAITFACLLFCVAFVDKRVTINLGYKILYYAIGAIISIFLFTLFHELGHKIAGQTNGFKCLFMQVWFFAWVKNGSKTNFKFAFLLGQAGKTDLVNTKLNDISKRYKRTIWGALLMSFIPLLLGISCLFVSGLPDFVLCIWIMLLPIGAYSLLDNFLPMIYDGVKNDGAVLLGLNKKDDDSKVLVNLLAIQAELYSGKTPSEIDEKLYFDVPQLAEDQTNYFLLLNARYNYYLDKEDYDNAKKTISRLLSLEDYAMKEHMLVAKADALYNACTFDFDADKADELLYELDKYLNNYNTATNVRVKIAYILNVSQETSSIELFYDKAIREANKCQIKGLGLFETKLVNKLCAGKVDLQ